MIRVVIMGGVVMVTGGVAVVTRGVTKGDIGEEDSFPAGAVGVIPYHKLY